jgi:hypothetical protein
MADVNDVKFWEDVNERLEELRLKAAILSETYLAVREISLASAAHKLGADVLSLRGISEDRIQVLKLREGRKPDTGFSDIVGTALQNIAKGDVGKIKLHGTATGRLSTNEPPFEEVPEVPEEEEKGS